MEEVITFEDKNLEAVIRKEINKPTGHILKSDVEKITKIWFCGEAYSKEVEEMTNIPYSERSKNNISNIEPIRELTNLTYLNLDRNNITNIEPLSNLTNLIEANIISNPVDDYSLIESISKNIPAFRYDKMEKK